MEILQLVAKIKNILQMTPFQFEAYKNSKLIYFMELFNNVVYMIRLGEITGDGYVKVVLSNDM